MMNRVNRVNRVNRLLLACIALVATVATAAPPAQSDLTTRQLARMKPDERAALEQRVGFGFFGFGTDGTLLGGVRDDIIAFNGRIVVLQRWSMRDAASMRSVEALHESLADLDKVLIVALHGPEKPEVLSRVLERKPLPGTAVLDESGSLVGPLAIDVRGGNFIIDQMGAIRYAGVDTASVRPLVLELLDNPSRAAPELTIEQLAAQLKVGENLRAAIEQAWTSGNIALAEAKMRELWQQAPAAASDITMRLLTAPDTVQRPLAIALFVQYGSQRQILNAISSLDPRRDSPEITILVRALGSETLEEPQTVLAPFLDSRDLDIRQAALYALADSAGPEVIETFVREMSNAPVSSNSWDTNERERMLGAQFGVAYRLTGVRANTGSEVADWLALYSRDPAAAAAAAKRSVTDDSGNPQRVRFSSDEFRTYGIFDLTVRNQETDNELPDESLPGRLQSAAAQAAQRAEPVLGKVYLPPIRVYLADHRGFSSLSSNSFMGGQTRVNQVYLRLVEPRALEAVMAHEWIHVLHAALFDKTPRWLAEGVAESLSSTANTVDSAAVARARAGEAIEKGLFTQLLTWRSGASSDSREADNYALAKLGIDFLRFGPFTAGDVRLNLLLGHISRGRGERDALEQAFGMSIRDLDQAIRDFTAAP